MREKKSLTQIHLRQGHVELMRGWVFRIPW